MLSVFKGCMIWCKAVTFWLRADLLADCAVCCQQQAQLCIQLAPLCDVPNFCVMRQWGLSLCSSLAHALLQACFTCHIPRRGLQLFEVKAERVSTRCCSQRLHCTFGHVSFNLSIDVKSKQWWAPQPGTPAHHTTTHTGTGQQASFSSTTNMLVLLSIFGASFGHVRFNSTHTAWVSV